MEDQFELALEEIKEYWGVETATKLALAAEAEYKDMEMGEFLNNCIACGGDWGGMLLSGIKALYPMTYEAIPDEMGRMAFPLICCVLILLGIDTEN